MFTSFRQEQSEFNFMILHLYILRHLFYKRFLISFCIQFFNDCNMMYCVHFLPGNLHQDFNLLPYIETVNIKCHSSGLNVRSAMRDHLNESLSNYLSPVKILWLDVRFVFQKNVSVLKNSEIESSSREFPNFEKGIHQTMSILSFKW